MDGDRCGRQGRSYDSAHASSQIAAAVAEPVDDALAWCILLMRAAGARFGRCPGLFREADQQADPVIGEQFQAGRTLREENPAIRLVFARDPARGIPPCAACHGPGDHKLGAPQLKTQQPAYIERQLAAFAQGFRQNDINEMMRTIAAQLTPDEMHVIAEFYGTGAAVAQVAER
jgi:cytochrome c553